MRLRQIVIIVIAFVFASPTFADEKKEAMFGLNWGMTPKAISSLGITLIKVKEEKNFQDYSTESLPKNLSDIEKYYLVFSDDKLVKIIASCKNITNDPTGSDGKERFDVLNKSLQDKYGTPTHKFQYNGRKLFKEYDEFYECLRYAGCGNWACGYEKPTKVIVLELKGLSRGTGYISLQVEAVPEWGDALNKFKSIKNKSDADAM